MTCGHNDRPLREQHLMDEVATVVCPACGEELQLALDPSAGSVQRYVEDCAVCCRPNVILVEFDRDGSARVSARSE